MLVSLYILSILYTNTMGLIIISKCKPFINDLIEKKGYIIKHKSDSEYINDFVRDSVMFLVPGYFLKKALKMTDKNANIDKLIKQMIKDKEIVLVTPEEKSDVSIFKGNDGRTLSLGNYEKSQKYTAVKNESMYTEVRCKDADEVDMDFWEEEEKEISQYVDSGTEEVVVRKEPVAEYLDSISEEEMLDMIHQIETIRRLKKDKDSLLNGKAA